MDDGMRRRGHPAWRQQGWRRVRPAQPERSRAGAGLPAAGCARSRTTSARCSTFPHPTMTTPQHMLWMLDEFRAHIHRGTSPDSSRANQSAAWAARSAAPRPLASAWWARSARRSRRWASGPTPTAASIIWGFGNVAQYAIRLYELSSAARCSASRRGIRPTRRRTRFAGHGREPRRTAVHHRPVRRRHDKAKATMIGYRR